MNGLKRHKSRSSRAHRRKMKLRGGNKSFLTPPPIIEQPLKYGATNPSEEAYLHQQAMNQNQQSMINGEPPVQSGGAEGIVVPQMQTSLSSSPNDANNISVELNKTLTQQQSNSQMDGCVGQGGACTAENTWDGKGGKRKNMKKKYSRVKKYRLTKKMKRGGNKKNGRKSRKHKSRKYKTRKHKSRKSTTRKHKK